MQTISGARANKLRDASQLHKRAQLLGSKLAKANRQNVNQKNDDGNKPGDEDNSH